MIEDTFATVLCPVCGRRLDGTSMRCNDISEDRYTEYRRCPCGAGFSLEVAVDDTVRAASLS